jgi:hypothetical protein
MREKTLQIFLELFISDIFLCWISFQADGLQRIVVSCKLAKTFGGRDFVEAQIQYR